MGGPREKYRSLFFLPAEQAVLGHVWRPLADIYQTRDGWLVKFDLAGIRPSDVRVGVNDRWLTIEGIRRDWVCQEGHCYHSLEIQYSKFSRSVELPCHLEEMKIKLEYRDGMLLVWIAPKGEDE